MHGNKLIKSIFVNWIAKYSKMRLNKISSLYSTCKTNLYVILLTLISSNAEPVDYDIIRLTMTNSYVFYSHQLLYAKIIIIIIIELIIIEIIKGIILMILIVIVPGWRRKN